MVCADSRPSIVSQVREDANQVLDPGQGSGDTQVSASGAVGESGGHMGQPVAQGCGFGLGQRTGHGSRRSQAAIAVAVSQAVLIANSRGGNLRRPLSLARPMRSSMRACARRRASSNGSCPVAVLVTNALIAPVVALFEDRQLGAGVGRFRGYRYGSTGFSRWRRGIWVIAAASTSR